LVELGTDLNRFILEEERRYPNATGSLSLALMAIESAAKIIAAHVRMAGLADILGKSGGINVHGEEVQRLDVFANNLMIKHLSDSGQFYALASEELEEVLFPENGKNGKYIIAFDPLDGSSNIDVNVNVGTIFSIHKRLQGTQEDFLIEGRAQVAAGYILYGTSTMLVYTTGNGVNGFTLDPSVGLFLLSHPDIKIPARGKIYSINESNYHNWDQRLKRYIDNLKQKGYTLRYAGAMVADVHRILIRGGMFAYPPDSKNKKGKLRLIYEASPMAFIIEQAGGKATTGEEDILKFKPSQIHERIPVFIGSREDIEEFLNMV
jgi:fructose-1,6-bisphosphatase I